MAVVGGAVLAISAALFFRVSLLPSIGRSLSLPASELSLLTVVFAVGRLLTDLPAGRLADVVPAPASFATAALLLAGGSVLLAAAHATSVVLAAAFVLGISSAITNTTGMTYFSSVAPTARRGVSLAVYSASLLGGQALGPTASGLVASASGWRSALVAASALGLAIAVGAGFVLLRGGARPRRPRRRPRPAERTPAASVSVPGVPLRERVVLYAVPFAMFFTMGAMPQTLVPLIGADRLDLSAAGIGLALGLGGIARFLGATAGGVVSDRVSRKAALVPGLALTSGGVGLLAVRAGTWVWVAAIVLFSVGSFGVNVAATMLADRSGPAGIGSRLGTFRFIGDIGLIAGPLVGGLLYEHVSPTAAVLAVCALVAAAALLSALALPETRWTAGASAVPSETAP